MGKWSGYSEEWETRQVKKMLCKALEEGQRENAIYKKQPRLVQRLIDAAQTASYYVRLMWIWIRKHCDRRYRNKMEAGVTQIMETVANIVKEKEKQD